MPTVVAVLATRTNWTLLQSKKRQSYPMVVAPSGQDLLDTVLTTPASPSYNSLAVVRPAFFLRFILQP